MKPLWNPEYAALVARRNAGFREVGRARLLEAYRTRQAFAALCDCDALVVDPALHRDWCGYRHSAELPPPTYDVAAQAATQELINSMRKDKP